MSGISPTPPVNAGYFIDTFEITQGDPLRLVSKQNPAVFVQFPYDTSITLSKKKTLSKTYIAGREGSIKEVSGVEDWDIDIEAEFVALNYDTSLLPKIRHILFFFSDIGKVKVVNRRMNAAGIEFLFIEKLDLPDNTYYSQTVRISGFSDNEYLLDFFQTGGG